MLYYLTFVIVIKVFKLFKSISYELNYGPLLSLKLMYRYVV